MAKDYTDYSHNEVTVLGWYEDSPLQPFGPKCQNGYFSVLKILYSSSLLIKNSIKVALWP